MLQRLRYDFKLSAMTLTGCCAVLIVIPSIIYRWYSGTALLGLLGCLFLAVVIGTVVYAWRTGRVETSASVFSAAGLTGAVTVGLMLNTTGFIWLYPACVGSFVLTRPVQAVVFNTMAVLALVLLGDVFASTGQMLAFVASTIGVSIGACVFALRNEYQRQQLERLAIFDALTGIRNRRAMDIGLRNAVTNAARTRVQYALVMMDLDHFKEINDAYGHAVGDKVLIECATLLQQNVRGADRLYRFGGEEFVIVLTGVSQGGMRIALADLRRELALKLKCHDQPVTASFGATLLRAGETPESWLDRADVALYRAKSAGRNCVVIDSGDEHTDDYVLLQEVA